MHAQKPARIAVWLRGSALGAVLVLIVGCRDPIELPTSDAPSSEDMLIENLAQAYRARDAELLASLLARDPARNAEFRFIRSAPAPGANASWGIDTETRVHQRMFHADHMKRIEIELRRESTFTERFDLYSEDQGRDGKLDPAVWRAVDARYVTTVFFETPGVDDYFVDSVANFVIIEDRTKPADANTRFHVLVWEDLCSSGPQLDAVFEACWSDVKGMFAP
jgi:hypothetical protein